MSNRIILIDDVYEIRRRKEEELRFYNEQLDKLKDKMRYVQAEINLTNTIIEIIENEKVLDIKQYITSKKKDE